MKKGYICKCDKCGFKTKEKNKTCPICNTQMQVLEDKVLDLNPTLPEKIVNDNHKDIEMGYYCFKCRKKMKTKVCLDCNNVGSLYLEYNDKKAIIKRVNRLTDVFDNQEMDVILNELTDQEKVYIYHNYESSYRFFYKKDKNKSLVCFIFAIIFYLVLLDMTFNMKEQDIIFMSYVFNAIGNWFLLTLSTLGIWYLIDASNVEFMKIPVKVGVISLIPNLIQLAICLAKGLDMKMMLITGFIALFIGIICDVIYTIWELKHEK